MRYIGLIFVVLAIVTFGASYAQSASSADVSHADADSDSNGQNHGEWPDGVVISFVASGLNYGNIGDLTITNTSDKPVTCSVPPGTLLDSGDPTIQDLYVADVPTETPCSGAAELGQPITLAPGESHTISQVPGFCPDFELAPPAEGESDNYTCRPPDEKGEQLLSVVEAAGNLDIGEAGLDVFGEQKVREMVTQGACWMADSKIDEEPDNDVTSEQLTDRFWDTFTTAADEQLTTMPAEQRDEAEDMVRRDIKKIVAMTSFVAKQDLENGTTDGDRTDTDDGSTIEIDNDPDPAVAAPEVAPKCNDCRLILIFGSSLKYNGTTDEYELSNKPLQKAHEAAANFATGKKAGHCLRVVHMHWKDGSKTAPSHWLLEVDGGKSKYKGVKSWTIKKAMAQCDDGTKIDCFSEVMVIYHGERKQTTKDVLKWLLRYTKVPIERLILWSCYGSEQINAKTLGKYMSTMAKRFAKTPLCPGGPEVFTGANFEPSPEDAAGLKEKDLKKIRGRSMPLGIDPDGTNMKLLTPTTTFKRYSLDGEEIVEGEEKDVEELFDGVPIEKDGNLVKKALKKHTK